ncbi:MAG: Cystathionine beta-lyase, type II, partial [uncultured Blastococcus sp.]
GAPRLPPRLRSPLRGLAADRGQPEVDPVRAGDRGVRRRDGLRHRTGGHRRPARGRGPWPAGLPDHPGRRRPGPRLRCLAAAPVRLGGPAPPHHPARRRRRRAAGGRGALHPAGRRRRPAHAGVHAVPRRPRPAGPRAHPGAHGRAGRPPGLRPGRDRRRLRPRRAALRPRQPAQPARARVRRRGAARPRRRRRAGRRPGLRRRDPRAAGAPGRGPPPLRVPLGGHGPAHRHGDVGLQGLEPAGAQGGAADPEQRRGRRPLGAGGLPGHPRRLHAGGPGRHGRLRRRRAVAGRRPGLSRRQPPAPGRAARRTAAGRPLGAARGHLPGLAGLPRPGPADHGREVLPRAGRGGDGRRTRVRRPWGGARPAQ